MTKRCEHCKHFKEITFDQETESGWGIWNGYCWNEEVWKRVKSLYYACEYFEPTDEYLNNITKSQLIENHKIENQQLSQFLEVK